METEGEITPENHTFLTSEGILKMTTSFPTNFVSEENCDLRNSMMYPSSHTYLETNQNIKPERLV